MRILHSVLSLDMGGAHLSAVQLACGMKKAGHMVFLSHGPNGGRKDKSHPVLLRRLADCGVQLVPIPSLGRDPAPAPDLRALRETSRLLSELAPDILNTHSAKPGLFAALCLHRPRRTLHVHTVRGYYHERTAFRLHAMCLKYMERFVYRRADQLVALSPRMVESAGRKGLAPAESFRVIRSGFNTEHFRSFHGRSDEARAALEIPQGVPVAGAVCALVDEKLILDLGRAFLKIADADPRTVFVLVGDGPLREAFLKLTRPLGTRLRFMGLMADPAACYAAMDCLLISSRCEGLPRVAVEAFCVGTPVVSTDVGAVGEIVRDGDTGFLVRVGDWKALADSAMRILRDPGLRRSLGERGRGMIGAEFGLDAVTRSYLDLYKEMMGAERP